jgi:hypothetical protein
LNESTAARANDAATGIFYLRAAYERLIGFILQKVDRDKAFGLRQTGWERQ